MNSIKYIQSIISLIIFSSWLFGQSGDNPLKLLQEIPAKTSLQTEPSDMFNVPLGVAVKNNTGYITDLGRLRIVKINLTTMQYAGEITVRFHNKPESFLLGRPAFDNQGNLWVSDMENGRIMKIDENTGEILYQFGSLGQNSGQFHVPNGLTFDTAGNLWVADELNNRIQKCNPANGQCAIFETGVSSFPQDLIVKGNSLFVCLTWYNQVLEYEIKSMKVIRVFGPDTPFTDPAKKQKLNTPRGLAIDSNGNLYISDNLNNRIVVFNPDGSVSKEIKNAAFLGPTGIKIIPENNSIVVAQSLSHFFHKYSLDGTLIGMTGKPRNLPFQLNFPNGSSFIKDTIAVADTFNNRIQLYNQKGIYLKSITGFNYPNDVVYDNKNQKIYVSDLDNTFLNGRIRVYDQNFNSLDITISFPLFFPYKMAVDSQGSLFVTDKIMDVVYKISGNDYKILFTYSTHSQPYDQKTGIAIHPITDKVYVIDSGVSKILIFDNQLKLISSIGKMGHDDGEFFFPGDIAFNANGKYMLVADSGNFRVQFFDGEGNWKETIGDLGYTASHFFGLIVSRNMREDFFLLNSAYLNSIRIYQTGIFRKSKTKFYKLKYSEKIMLDKLKLDKKELQELRELLTSQNGVDKKAAQEIIMKHFLK